MREHLQRQSFLGGDSDSILEASTVAIVGLCGGGSHVAQQLAHVGVGTFLLFDPDTADESNRNRMVGLTAASAAARARKTDVIEALIHGVNPTARVQSFPGRWQDHHADLRACTAMFGCVDSFGEREQLERYARRFMTPYIDVGMDVHGTPGRSAISGQVILSLPGHPCMRCMGFLTDNLLAEEARRYGNVGGKPQVVWPNGTLASIAVGKFMSLVTPWHDQLVPALYTEYDGNRLTAFPSRKLDVIAGKTCPHFAGPDALGEIAWSTHQPPAAVAPQPSSTA
jgi:molybdopterin-synthase adenylyltransferase